MESILLLLIVLKELTHSNASPPATRGTSFVLKGTRDMLRVLHVCRACNMDPAKGGTSLSGHFQPAGNKGSTGIAGFLRAFWLRLPA